MQPKKGLQTIVTWAPACHLVALWLGGLDSSNSLTKFTAGKFRTTCLPNNWCEQISKALLVVIGGWKGNRSREEGSGRATQVVKGIPGQKPPHGQWDKSKSGGAFKRAWCKSQSGGQISNFIHPSICLSRTTIECLHPKHWKALRILGEGDGKVHTLVSLTPCWWRLAINALVSLICLSSRSLPEVRTG